MKDWVKVRFVLLALCCLAVLVSVGILSTRWLANLVAGGVPPPNASLLPADHGLPDTIAGFQILAVKTSETTACTPPGTVRLVLHSGASDAQEAMSMNISAVYQELERLVPDSGLRWQIGVVGPNAPTAAQMAIANARMNADYAEHGCPEPLGGPIVILTPTPIVGGSSTPSP